MGTAAKAGNSRVLIPYSCGGSAALDVRSGLVLPVWFALHHVCMPQQLVNGHDCGGNAVLLVRSLVVPAALQASVAEHMPTAQRCIAPAWNSWTASRLQGVTAGRLADGHGFGINASLVARSLFELAGMKVAELMPRGLHC